MKIIISPAKSLDFETNLPINKYTQGVFLDEASKINSILKKKSPKKLSELMTISSNLAELNWQRNQDWKLPFTSENARQAIYAFKGDVYIGLDAYSLNEDQIIQLQQNIQSI